ncbi:DUF1090 domain-containing protein [Serratia symbiotica]|uniref:DUF1090 domain-containing protein n=1 Tax=Serratia symbiotica TaxID=138074 RepID=UPI003CC8742C
MSFALEDSCASKAQNIQHQIDYSTQYGNIHRVTGLKKALSEVQTTAPTRNLQAERQKKIDEKQSKVAKRQQEIKQETQTDNLEKVAKKQNKLTTQAVS